jgi:hypothetical protein
MRPLVTAAVAPLATFSLGLVLWAERKRHRVMPLEPAGE